MVVKWDKWEKTCDNYLMSLVPFFRQKLSYKYSNLWVFIDEPESDGKMFWTLVQWLQCQRVEWIPRK